MKKTKTKRMITRVRKEKNNNCMVFVNLWMLRQSEKKPPDKAQSDLVRPRCPYFCRALCSATVENLAVCEF